MNKRKLFRTTNALLYELSDVSFPDHIPPDDLSNNFGNYFAQKIGRISDSLDALQSSELLDGDVPQGTLLGPPLFLLYIYDLPNCLLTSSYPRMYADDTHLTYADKDVNIIQSCLNEDLLNISKWLITNKLILNMTKTEFMLIGSRQKLNAVTASPVLSINGTPVNHVSTSKSLGVLIDTNLTWGSHIEKLAKKLSLLLQLSNESGNLFSQQHCILSTKP